MADDVLVVSDRLDQGYVKEFAARMGTLSERGLREPGRPAKPSATLPASRYWGARARPPRGLPDDGVAGRVADGDPDSAGCCRDAAGDSGSLSEREGADDSVRARVDLRDPVRGPVVPAADPAGRPDGTGADRDGTGLLGGEIEAVEDL